MRHCLEKDPDGLFQSASDPAFLLGMLLQTRENRWVKTTTFRGDVVLTNPVLRYARPADNLWADKSDAATVLSPRSNHERRMRQVSAKLTLIAPST